MASELLGFESQHALIILLEVAASGYTYVLRIVSIDDGEVYGILAHTWFEPR
jgi:hypothetical protein